MLFRHSIRDNNSRGQKHTSLTLSVFNEQVSVSCTSTVLNLRPGTWDSPTPKIIGTGRRETWFVQ